VGYAAIFSVVYRTQDMTLSIGEVALASFAKSPKAAVHHPANTAALAALITTVEIPTRKDNGYATATAKPGCSPVRKKTEWRFHFSRQEKVDLHRIHGEL
jgi:hypothetical protein